jgi:hypothetical protein
MTSTQGTFDNLLFIARPGAGKSEIVAHIHSQPVEQRINLFHIGEFEVLDDFPMLWTWFEEDSILEELGHPRLHTDHDQYFLYPYLWDVLIQRINLEYQKTIRDHPDFHKLKTMLIEFSRGTSHGGYQRAFQHLSQRIAQKLAILYVNVSWEESLRKNRLRYNPAKPDSILEHGLSDDKMSNLYRHTDWEELTSNQPDTILIQDVPVPYLVFENEDDLTSRAGPELTTRLSETLSTLYNKYQLTQNPL